MRSPFALLSAVALTIGWAEGVTGETVGGKTYTWEGRVYPSCGLPSMRCENINACFKVIKKLPEGCWYNVGIFANSEVPPYDGPVLWRHPARALRIAGATVLDRLDFVSATIRIAHLPSAVPETTSKDQEQQCSTREIKIKGDDLGRYDPYVDLAQGSDCTVSSVFVQSEFSGRRWMVPYREAGGGRCR